MNRAQTPGPMGIVTSDAVHGRSLPIKMIVLILGGIVLLVLLAGGAFYLVKYKPGVHKTPAPQTVTQLTPAQAIAKAKSQLADAHTSTEKQAAYTALGDAYLASGQTSASTTAYQAALSYSPDDIPLLERLSGEYEDAGDYANAVKTLQQLIPLLQASNTQFKDRLLSHYQAELQYYQGKL